MPSPTLSYLTLWPDSEDQPAISTLNAADGWVTSNMAIVPNVNGKTDAYARGVTQLILDISAYFAPYYLAATAQNIKRLVRFLSKTSNPTASATA